MNLVNTCGYRSNPDLQPNEFCGVEKEKHSLLIHPFIPSNIVKLHITGVDGNYPCEQCGTFWFVKEDDFVTCVNCRKRFQLIYAKGSDV